MTCCWNASRSKYFAFAGNYFQWLVVDQGFLVAREKNVVWGSIPLVEESSQIHFHSNNISLVENPARQARNISIVFEMIYFWLRWCISLLPFFACEHVRLVFFDLAFVSVLLC